MGWFLTAAAEDVPQVEGTDTSIIVALIAALGTVLVALIGLTAQWLSSRRTMTSPPHDPKLGERVAVTETIAREDRRTLSQLDRHVDGIGDRLDKLRWDFDDLKARYETHNRKHHGDQ